MFGLLLDQLKHYNDSLYHLYRPFLEATIARDVVAAMIASSEIDTLADLKSLAIRGHAESPVYSEVTATASNALRIRLADSDPLPMDAVIAESNVDRDHAESNLATYNGPLGRQYRVLLEKRWKIEPYYTKENYDLAWKHLMQLVSLLRTSKSTANFRTLRCLGYRDCPGNFDQDTEVTGLRNPKGHGPTDRASDTA